jgi:hypothetical protein
VNTALIILQDALAKQNQALRKRITETDDPDMVQALLNEMTETSHRLQLVGALLFAAQSNELDAAVDKVKAATVKVNKSISTLKDVARMLDTISSFLGLVDDAIDMAKLLLL